MDEISFVTSPLHEMRAWQLTSALALGMLVASEIGYRVGRGRHERVGDAGRGHFTAIQAALLALLALLLGFTFNMANVRFDARRQGVLDAANNFAALGQRSKELPEPQRGAFRKLLGECLALQAIKPSQILKAANPEAFAQRVARSEELHGQLWEVLRSQGPNPPRVTETIAVQLTEAQSLLRKRVYVYLNRVPDPILVLLFAAALGAGCVVGFSAGLGLHRGRYQTIALMVFVCGTIKVILDLDRPISGLQVDQSPIIHLYSKWQKEE